SAGHLFFRDIVTGMAGQARIEHLSNPRLLLQEGRNSHCVGVLLSNTQCQCFQTAFNQPRRVCVCVSTIILGMFPDSFNVIPSAESHSADNSAVTSDILSAAMRNDINT